METLFLMMMMMLMMKQRKQLQDSHHKDNHIKVDHNKDEKKNCNFCKVDWSPICGIVFLSLINMIILSFTENKAPLKLKQIKNIWANVGGEHLKNMLLDAIIDKMQLQLNVNICFFVMSNPPLTIKVAEMISPTFRATKYARTILRADEQESTETEILGSLFRV